MKKIFIIAIGALLFNASQAQTIDRSKKPKAGPAPVITIGDPVKYTLPNGITILVVENHSLPKVSAAFSIDAGPVKEGNKAGVAGLMGQMLNEGTTKRSKVDFDEAVEQMGANVGLNAGGASVSALTRYFDKAFMLMAEGMRNPAFSQSSFDKLKSQTLTNLKASERSAKAISGRVVNALVYGTDNPMGEFTSEATINAITLDDIKNAYKQSITPSRSCFTFVGDIKPEAAKALVMKAFGDWTGTKLTLPVIADVSNPATTEIDLIDVPSAVQSEITVVNLVKLPMNSPDYFPLIIANNILGGGSEARLFMNLREKHAFTYGAYSSVSAGRYQTTFSASTSVRNEKADSAVAEILNEIKRMRETPVSAEELQNTKALYNGTFALGMENPARIASFANNILLNDLPKDFYRTYLQKINAVTVADVKRVSQKYFNYSNTRVVVVGKAGEVGSKLKQLGYAVNQYDSYAKPIAATVATTTNVSATDVINNYIKAIGGEDAVKKVNTVWMDMDMVAQGNTLQASQKQMNPNKEVTEITMDGNVVMKQLFDGENGFQMQGGQKMNMSTDEIKIRKANTNIIPQVDYNTANKMEVKGVEKINGKDAYKLAITNSANITSTEYYDVASGYLVKQENTLSINGNDIQKTTEFDDYQKVNGVYFPFSHANTITMGANQQQIAFKVKSLKVNEGVSAADFK